MLWHHVLEDVRIRSVALRRPVLLPGIEKRNALRLCIGNESVNHSQDGTYSFDITLPCELRVPSLEHMSRNSRVTRYNGWFGIVSFLFVIYANTDTRILGQSKSGPTA